MAENLPAPASRDLALAQALAHIPGFASAEAKITPLQGGSLNRSYLVGTAAGRFVVRCSTQPDAWLASDRSVERALHAVAAAAGLAPRIVHAGPCDRWLITEFVAGVPWSDAHFLRRECLEVLGDTLRALHAIPPPMEGRFDLLEALGRYVQRLEEAPDPEEVHARESLEQARVAWQLSGAAERAVAVLHHDLHGSNLIESHAGQLLLVDWECAVVNDPLLDIACVLSYFPPARAHADVLLDRAGLRGVTERQLAASVWLFDLHTWLWYRERRMRLVPTAAELGAEARLARTLRGGIPSAL